MRPPIGMAFHAAVGNIKDAFISMLLLDGRLIVAIITCITGITSGVAFCAHAVSTLMGYWKRVLEGPGGCGMAC